MLDPTLNLNINKPKGVIDFSNKLAKYEAKTMQHRKKILNCKKCDKNVLEKLNTILNNIDKDIATCDKYYFDQVNDPFVHVIKDPSQIIANLKTDREDTFNILKGIDLSELC